MRKTINTLKSYSNKNLVLARSCIFPMIRREILPDDTNRLMRMGDHC